MVLSPRWTLQADEYAWYSELRSCTFAAPFGGRYQPERVKLQQDLGLEGGCDFYFASAAKFHYISKSDSTLYRVSPGCTRCRAKDYVLYEFRHVYVMR